MTRKQAESDVRRELMQRIRTEGVVAAYEAARDVCCDQKAPAPARATAAATLFRVAGYFSPRESDTEREPHEMTPDELSAAVERAVRELDEIGTADAEDAIDEGVFG